MSRRMFFRLHTHFYVRVYNLSFPDCCFSHEDLESDT